MVNYGTVSQNGDSPVLSYNLWYDQGSGEWISLTDTISQQHLVENLQAG